MKMYADVEEKKRKESKSRKSVKRDQLSTETRLFESAHNKRNIFSRLSGGENQRFGSGEQQRFGGGEQQRFGGGEQQRFGCGDQELFVGGEQHRFGGGEHQRFGSVEQQRFGGGGGRDYKYCHDDREQRWSGENGNNGGSRKRQRREPHYDDDHGSGFRSSVTQDTTKNSRNIRSRLSARGSRR